MKKLLYFIIFVIIFLIAGYLIFTSLQKPEHKSAWVFQSIDTMKYSRDLSREKITNKEFDKVIEAQITNIAATGATHVAIATPYDEEFYPILKRWVDEARRQKLHVWFRGNFSGWEGWFEYPRISRDEHLKKTKEFIEKHIDLFQDGDIFTPCPECENGGPGDPRVTGDTAGFSNFLIQEYDTSSSEFKKLHKSVLTGYNSMNADVARLIMNPEVTQKLGGIVVIDHYVKTPEQLQSDIIEIAKNSRGKVVLGEFGAPIPNINGDLSEQEQYEWVKNALSLLKNTPELTGLNYWVANGGSTQLWNDDNTPRLAVTAITEAYKNKPNSQN